MHKNKKRKIWIKGVSNSNCHFFDIIVFFFIIMNQNPNDNFDQQIALLQDHIKELENEYHLEDLGTKYNLDELKNYPSLQEIQQQYLYTESNKDDYDPADLQDKLKNLDFGKFQLHENLEVAGSYNILQEINETKFPISYTSPYEGMETGNTIYVDPKKIINGSYGTISEAIEEAMPGDKIVLEPGTYNESIVISKPVEIIGKVNKNAKLCQIESNESDAIIMDTNVARISNIKIECSAPGNCFSVRVKSGFLEINDCGIISNCNSVFRIEGGSNIWAKNCNIITSTNYTSLMPNSRSFFESCTFESNKLKKKNDNNNITEASLTIGEGSTAILIGCSYTQTSIIFQQNSEGMIKGQSVIGGVRIGVSVLAGAKALLLELNLQECTQHAIYLASDSHAVIQKCTIQNCRNKSQNPEKKELTFNNAILIQGSYNFAFVESKICNNDIGIRTVGSTGLILDSEFSSNGRFGKDISINIPALQLEASSNITVMQSKFIDNKTAFVFLADDDATEVAIPVSNITNCSFTENETSLFVKSGATIKVSSSTFINEKLIFSGSENCNIEYNDCTISHSKTNESSNNPLAFKTAMIIKKSCKAFITSTRIQNYCTAIRCYDESTLTVASSEIKCSITLIQKSHADIKDSTIMPMVLDQEDPAAINLRDDSSVNVISSTIESQFGIEGKDRAIIECDGISIHTRSKGKGNKFGIANGIRVSLSQLSDAQTNLTISNSEFKGEGKLVFSTNALFKIDRCYFINDSIQQGSDTVSIHAENSMATITNSTFQNNTISIQFSQCSASLQGCAFLPNSNNKRFNQTAVKLENGTLLNSVKCVFKGLKNGFALEKSSQIYVSEPYYENVENQVIGDESCQILDAWPY